MLTTLLKESPKNIEILNPNSDKNYINKILTDLNIPVTSLFQEVITNTGGILIDQGWLRIIGSGDAINRNILDWNKDKISGILLIADDILGGFFAVNLGYFHGEIGSIFYFAPELLEWEDLEMKYTDFINWAIKGDTNKFYESFRWNGWEDEIHQVGINKGLSVYPFLWTENMGIKDRSRKLVPIDEIWSLSMDFYSKIGS